MLQLWYCDATAAEIQQKCDSPMCTVCYRSDIFLTYGLLMRDDISVFQCFRNDFPISWNYLPLSISGSVFGTRKVKGRWPANQFNHSSSEFHFNTQHCKSWRTGYSSLTQVEMNSSKKGIRDTVPRAVSNIDREYKVIWRLTWWKQLWKKSRKRLIREVQLLLV